jgi:hypothetical protein
MVVSIAHSNGTRLLKITAQFQVMVSFWRW